MSAETVSEQSLVPGWAAWTLRVVTALTTFLVLVQPVYAGLFVTGNVLWLGMHSAGGVFIALLAIFQVVVAVLVWRPGRGPSWPIWASVVFLVLVIAQMGLGFARERAMHIPLGTLLFAFALVMLVAVWSPRLRRRRSEKSATLVATEGNTA